MNTQVTLIPELIAHATPAKVEFDVETFRAQMEANLDGYRLAVTNESLKGAKTAMAELNKAKKAIADRRKAIISEASAEISAFDSEVKDIEKLCDQYRGDIKAQVDKFEDESKVKVRFLLEQAADELMREHKVDSDFANVRIEDLVKLSAITAKGNLTSATKESITARVLTIKAEQEQLKSRLTLARAASAQAGLLVPFELDHVQAIINIESDEEYETALTNLIEREKERQQARTAEQTKAETTPVVQIDESAVMQNSIAPAAPKSEISQGQRDKLTQLFLSLQKYDGQVRAAGVESVTAAWDQLAQVLNDEIMR